MHLLFLLLVLPLMLATLGVLLAGLIGFARNSSSPARANAFMRWRVMLQACALAVLAVLMLALR